MTFMLKPLEWDETVRARIARTLTSDLGTARMIRDIRAGKRQVWSVSIDDKEAGVTVTELIAHADGTREAFIWAYQGREAVSFVRIFAYLALSCNCSQVGFYTFHRAALRGYKRFSPEVSNTGIPGEMRFTFDARKLLYADSIQ